MNEIVQSRRYGLNCWYAPDSFCLLTLQLTTFCLIPCRSLAPSPSALLPLLPPIRIPL